jgi:hypothetical protein
MSARSRREEKRLLEAWPEKLARLQTSEVHTLQVDDTLEISLPTINPMYIPGPRLYTGQNLSPAEQDVFDSLIAAAYEGDL